MRSRILGRRMCLLTHKKLLELTGLESYSALCTTHQKLVAGALANDSNNRQSHWTESVAVISKGFLDDTKAKLGVLAKSREVIEDGDFQLREETGIYNSVWGGKKDNIGHENAYLWDIILGISSG